MVSLFSIILAVDPGPFKELYLVLRVAQILLVVWVVLTITMEVRQMLYNNKQPIIRRRAKLLSQRQILHRRIRIPTMRMFTTRYLATFQLETGQIEEFRVSYAQSYLLTEEETGILVSQGTRFVGFQRILV